jgi:hypothetical protein
MLLHELDDLIDSYLKGWEQVGLVLPVLWYQQALYSQLLLQNLALSFLSRPSRGKTMSATNSWLLPLIDGIVGAKKLRRGHVTKSRSPIEVSSSGPF